MCRKAVLSLSSELTLAERHQLPSANKPSVTLIFFPLGEEKMNSQSILCLCRYRNSIRLAFTIAAFTALFLTATGQSQAQTGYGASRAQATVPSTPPPSNRPLRGQRHVARGAARGATLGAVGGAITGDAGKGAAAGAAMGGLAGGMRRRDQRLQNQQQQ